MIKAYYVGCDDCHGQAVSPDGERFEYVAGKMVYAQIEGSDDHGDYTEDWIYIGRDGQAGCAYDFDDDGAAAFIDRVYCADRELNADYWWIASRTYRDDLPDYVTNWYRPEYN